MGVAENTDSGGSGTFAGRLDVDDQTDSTSITTGAAVIDGGVGIAKNLNVGLNVKVGGNLELCTTNRLWNQGVGVCKTDYRLSSFNVSGVGVGVFETFRVQTKRTLWVSKNGCGYK